MWALFHFVELRGTVAHAPPHPTPRTACTAGFKSRMHYEMK